MQINLMTMKKGFQGSNRKADFPGNPLFVKGGAKSLMTQRCHSSRRGNPGPNSPLPRGDQGVYSPTPRGTQGVRPDPLTSPHKLPHIS